MTVARALHRMPALTAARLPLQFPALRISAAGPVSLTDEAISPLLSTGSGKRLRTALIVSVLIHAVLLTVHFNFPTIDPFRHVSPVLEVVLVNSRSATRPVKADALAQADLDGGGNTPRALRATTNLPVIADSTAEAQVQIAARRVQQLEQEAQRLMARIGEKGAATSQTTLPVEQLMKSDLEKMTDVSSEAQRIARLEAEIAKQWQAYQEMPKRTFVGARTTGAVYAEYVDQWRQKIERIGTANFPAEARARQEFGTVLVTVAIKADGSVEKIEIDRSSGSQLLDDAVRRIVELSLPYAAFPSKVRQETDILHITRTWSFTRSDLVVQ
jgi:protein TonB